jgi:hypothetical protein
MRSTECYSRAAVERAMKVQEVIHAVIEPDIMLRVAF